MILKRLKHCKYKTPHPIWITGFYKLNLSEGLFDCSKIKLPEVGHTFFNSDGPFTGFVHFEFIHHPIADGAFNTARL
jgi:hypothetical protein